MNQTNQQFDNVAKKCRKVFVGKGSDYGPAWRILRPTSLTDQILIKAKRIRTLETVGEAKINEGIFDELIGIVNYAIIGLIQLEKGVVDEVDMTSEDAIRLYDEKMLQAKTLMMNKNHDYGEAWRMMRTMSYTDLILMKINRTKQMEDNGGAKVSEGIDANYLDMINYAMFGLIKLDEQKE